MCRVTKPCCNICRAPDPRITLLDHTLCPRVGSDPRTFVFCGTVDSRHETTGATCDSCKEEQAVVSSPEWNGTGEERFAGQGGQAMEADWADLERSERQWIRRGGFNHVRWIDEVNELHGAGVGGANTNNPINVVNGARSVNEIHDQDELHVFDGTSSINRFGDNNSVNGNEADIVEGRNEDTNANGMYGVNEISRVPTAGSK